MKKIIGRIIQGLGWVVIVSGGVAACGALAFAPHAFGEHAQTAFWAIAVLTVVSLSAIYCGFGILGAGDDQSR